MEVVVLSSSVATVPPTADFIVPVVCASVVALYAYKRYNTPGTNRLSTIRSLFLLTLIGYIAASLALFVILSLIVLRPGILTFLGIENAQNLVKEYVDPDILAAVILTTLLPNLPVVGAADACLLKFFQDWGRIPLGVRMLADKMTQEALVIRPADLKDLEPWITSDGDIPNELAIRISVESAATSSGRLTRVLRVYKELEKLEQLPTYAQALRAQRDTWQAIQDDLRVFTAQSRAFFCIVRSVDADRG